jgi:hypothetical protein
MRDFLKAKGKRGKGKGSIHDPRPTPVLSGVEGIHVVLLLAALLGGCGVETATTAATGAAIKKQEIDVGKNTKEQVQQKIDQATQLMQENARRTAEAADK